jgi:glucose-1-phosphate cytidylyltransferase
MQVVILCGGEGTRIRDVAEDLPKPMLPIGDQPILWHIMKGYAHHGFKHFVLCLGYKSWVIKRYFLDNHLARSDFSLDLRDPSGVEIHAPEGLEDWRVTLAETGLKAMTGSRLKQVERYIDGDDFLLTYGDGVADVDVGALVRFHQSHGRIGTVTAVCPPGRFGEIEVKGGRITEFNEKPLLSRGRISGGFFVFQRRFLDLLSADQDLVLEQRPLMQLAQEGELMAYVHDGFWQPMDNSRDYRLLNDLWQKGRAPWDVWSRADKRPRRASRTAPARPLAHARCDHE